MLHRRFTMLVAWLTSLSVAIACPVCDTGTGSEVRAGIAGDDWQLNFLGAALPFVVMLGFAVVVHFEPWSRGRG